MNIAKTFISPLRQTRPGELHVSEHKQPEAANGMVSHLRRLPIRNEVGRVGFGAYTTLVVECDNLRAVKLWTAPPAPEPGESDHYNTFIDRIATFYVERFTKPPAPRPV